MICSQMLPLSCVRPSGRFFVAKVISLNPLKKQAVERANEYQGNYTIWNQHRFPPPNKVAQPP